MIKLSFPKYFQRVVINQRLIQRKRTNFGNKLCPLKEVDIKDVKHIKN